MVFCMNPLGSGRNIDRLPQSDRHSPDTPMKNPITHNIFRRLLSHPKYRLVVMAASLVYLLSPLDISPDVFPVVGWIDDGVLVTLVAAEMGQLVLERRQKVKENQQSQKLASVE